MQPQPPPAILQFLPLIFIFIIFYFFIIKPQAKKQKEHEALVKSLKKNDEIVFAGGIHGTIVGVKDKTFLVRVDDNAKLEIDKSAVIYVKKKRQG